eukprot:2827984-Karenia_brevis.AAC.1
MRPIKIHAINHREKASQIFLPEYTVRHVVQPQSPLQSFKFVLGHLPRHVPQNVTGLIDRVIGVQVKTIVVATSPVH